MSRLIVGLAAVIGLAAISLVQAGTMLTTSETKPSTNVLVSHGGVWNSAYSWNWKGNGGGAHNDLGQSFLISESNDVVLDKITLQAKNVGSGVEGQGYTIEIWEFSDSSDYVGNLLVNSQSDTLPSSGLRISYQYWTFDIEDVTLTNERYYGFLLSFDSGPDGGQDVDFVGNTPGGLFDGRLISRRGTLADWNGAFGGRDLDFALQGQVVPEPTTFAGLLSLSLAGLIGYRRHRRKAWQ